MNDIVTIFDAFYSKFVLRDFLAKIVPGLILLASIAISLAPSISFIITYVVSMSFWCWIAIFGMAWIASFAVQSFAEKYGFIRYYPEELDETRYYNEQITFSEISSILEKQIVERFKVIKEACGNSYVTLSIALILLAMDRILDTLSSGVPLLPRIYSDLLNIGDVSIILLGTIYFLHKMHFIHVNREYNYMIQVIESYNSASVSE